MYAELSKHKGMMTIGSPQVSSKQEGLLMAALGSPNYSQKESNKLYNSKHYGQYFPTEQTTEKKGKNRISRTELEDLKSSNRNELTPVD